MTAQADTEAADQGSEIGAKVLVVAARMPAWAEDDGATAAVPGLLGCVVDAVLPAADTPQYPIRPGVAAMVTLRLTRAQDAPGALEALFDSDEVDRGARSIEAYLVEERLQWDYDLTRPVGETTPGIKQVSFLERLPGLSRAEFADHWTGVHAPLARKHHPTIWRYVQNVVVERLTPAGPDLDGIAELHFRAFLDWRDRKFDSPAGQATINADVATFIDRGSLGHVLTRERILRVA